MQCIIKCFGNKYKTSQRELCISSVSIYLNCSIVYVYSVMEARSVVNAAECLNQQQSFN